MGPQNANVALERSLPIKMEPPTVEGQSKLGEAGVRSLRTLAGLSGDACRCRARPNGASTAIDPSSRGLKVAFQPRWSGCWHVSSASCGCGESTIVTQALSAEDMGPARGLRCLSFSQRRVRNQLAGVRAYWCPVFCLILLYNILRFSSGLFPKIIKVSCQ